MTKVCMAAPESCRAEETPGVKVGTEGPIGESPSRHPLLARYLLQYAVSRRASGRWVGGSLRRVELAELGTIADQRLHGSIGAECCPRWTDRLSICTP